MPSSISAAGLTRSAALSFFDAQAVAFEVLAVEGFNSVFGVTDVLEGDESEAFGFLGLVAANDAGVLDSAVTSEKFFELGFSHFGGEVGNVHVVASIRVAVGTRRSASVAVPVVRVPFSTVAARVASSSFVRTTSRVTSVAGTTHLYSGGSQPLKVSGYRRRSSFKKLRLREGRSGGGSSDTKLTRLLPLVAALEIN